MDASNRANPFPGLRPFNRDEAHLFFGRDRHSDDLVRRLARRFLAIVGTSGSGKSSLVRAGLVPSLESGLMAQAGTRWRIAIFRPQDDPIGFMARAIVESDALEHLDIERSAAIDVIETTLRRSSLGLIEAARLARLEPTENLLVLVDQFEELFRFADLDKDASRKDDAPAFVKLLLEAARQPDARLYVVITMRSDFLGDCARFRDLPEAISDGQFLIPRLTRDELQAAITGPMGVSGGRIAPGLVQDLLNAIGDDMDQLPVLQHALMRAWDRWDSAQVQRMHRSYSSALLDYDPPPMDREDLTEIGGLTEALSCHAEEAYGSLQTNRYYRIAERLFKCLTERGLDNREVRRPTPLARIAAIADAPLEEIVRVIEPFRAPQRAFLMPPYDVELSEDTVIDISHESLIRQWARLRTWVTEEADSRATYLRLVEAARLWKAGKGGLWGEPDLTYARQWQEREAPNAAWAERYAPGFDDAKAFLRASEEAHQTRIEEERQRAEAYHAAKERELEQARALAEAQRQRADVQAAARRRQSLFSVALVVLLIAAAMIAFYAWIQRGQAEYQGRLSLARQLASQSQLVREQRPDAYPGALLLAVEAVERSPLPLLEASQALRSLIAVMPRPVVQLRDVRFQGGNLLISPDGRRVAWYDNNPSDVFLWSLGGSPTDRRKLSDKFVVRYIDFSANSQRLVAGGPTSLRIWRVDDGRQEREIAPLTGAVAASVSDDGRHVAILRHNGMVQVWNEGSAPVTEIRVAQSAASPGPGRVGVVRFSPGGEFLAMGAYNHVLVCRVGDWSGCGAPLINFPFGLLGFSRREDGALALTVFGRGAFQSFALGPGAPAPIKPGFDGIPSGRAMALALSPNGRLAAPSTDAEAGTIWDIYHGEIAGDVAGGGYVTVLTFSPDSTRLAAGKYDRTAQVWDIASKRELARMTHGDGVGRVAFTPDGTHVVASSVGDARVTVWEAVGHTGVAALRGQPVRRDAMLASDRASAGQVEIAIAERETRSAGGDAVVRDAILSRWRPADGVVTKTIGAQTHTPLLSANGRRLWGARDESAEAWDTGTLTLAGTFQHQPPIDWEALRAEEIDRRGPSRQIPFQLQLLQNGGSVKVLGTSFDGEFAATHRADQTVRLWRIGSPAPVLTVKHEADILDANSVRAVFSPGGRYVALIWNGAERRGEPRSKLDVRLFQLPDGKEVARTALVWDNLVSAEISADESLMRITDYVGQLAVLELPSLRERWRQKDMSVGTLSPDGRFIAMAPRGKNTAVIAHAGTNVAAAQLATSGQVTSVAFSLDGELFAIGNDRNQVFVGRTRDGRTIASLTHDKPLLALAFTPDSEVLASVSEDHSTRLLDLRYGIEISRVTPRAAVSGLRFSADGKFLITEGETDVQIWLWRGRDLVDEACQRVTIDLTPEQWRSYLGDQSPIACRARFAGQQR